MITRLTIRNFKGFKETVIEMADHLVFIGANNSGKTTAIQALALWRQALTKWLEKRAETKSKATLRTGVAISRSDLTVLPLKDTRQMWNACRVQDEKNRKINIEILLEGNDEGREWVFGMELEYQGTEQLYCRPMAALAAPGGKERMSVPEHWTALGEDGKARSPATVGPNILFLPALAGLRRNEERTNDNSLRTRISEGRAGDVLRNLLLRVAERKGGEWEELTDVIRKQFQLELVKPTFLSTGEIRAEFHTALAGDQKRKNNNPTLDIAMGGSGFHQSLLILAFLFDQPGGVLLFDEPDAHLELIRQRQIFRMLWETAAKRHAQLVVCSHSEKIMDEVTFENIRAFYPGESSPLPLANLQQVSQLRKALMEVSSADFYYARLQKKILYVEDHTDVSLLKSWAHVLGMEELKDFLASPFVHYIGNVPSKARSHFSALHPAIPELRGFLLVDRVDKTLQKVPALTERMWRRREIENYLLAPAAILRWCGQQAAQQSLGELLVPVEKSKAEELLRRRMSPDAYENPSGNDPLFQDTKGSDDFLVPFFTDFYAAIGRYNDMPKSRLHELAAVMLPEEIHDDVKQVLRAIRDHFALEQVS